MADYHPLIARAIEGLGNSTGEARRSLYERARTALVTQLRSVEPALSESDITRERLALEDAIRRVESEAARRMRTEPRPEPRLTPPPPRPPRAEPTVQVPPPSALMPRRDRPLPPPPAMPPAPAADTARTESRRAEPPPAPDSNEPKPSETAQPDAPQSARSRLLNARTSTTPREPFRGFRDVVSEADDLGAATARSAQFARTTRDSYGTAPPSSTAQDDEQMLSRHGHVEPQLDMDHPESADDEASQLDSLEPPFETEDEQPMLPPRYTRPHAPRAAASEEEFGQPRPPRSYRGFAKLAVVLIILAGLAVTVSWQWSNITGLYQFVSHMRSRQANQTTQTPAAQPKFPGRVPQQDAGQAPDAGAPGAQTAPAVAQRVVLYEEEQNNPQGKQFVGSAVWRTETVSPGPGLAPELAVRADIEIPERRMTVTWSLRRNPDAALPASHTIEVMFNLPADFPGGGIANVPGVLMKQSEQARGTPLAGLAVKVTTGFFLIGLSNVDADVQRNVQLLKDRPWFDIPLVYNNGGRAILAMEKGPPGDRAFAEAFAAWAK